MKDGQCDLFDDNPEYAAFVAKFEPKKTTDDCYTPGPVYEAVADWVAREFGLDRERFLRPFYPGGDYQREEYPEGFVVVDNPPFSILSRIVRDYERWGVPFFLFAPTLTLFSTAAGEEVCYLPCDASITYENGAKVNTSFVTNLDREHRIRCEPELYAAVTRANRMSRKATAKPGLPKYRYPDCCATAAGLNPLARAGVRFAVPKEETAFVRALDAQRAQKKVLFGGGFLLSSRAAAERAAAERAAAERAAAERAAAERAAAERAAAEERIEWKLSEREREIIRRMDEKAKRREDTHEGRGRKEETELAAEPGF